MKCLDIALEKVKPLSFKAKHIISYSINNMKLDMCPVHKYLSLCLIFPFILSTILVSVVELHI